MKSILLLLLVAPLAAQPIISSQSTTATQAVVSYAAPDSSACSFQAADMNRGITIASSSWAGGTATITTAAMHGLLVGSTPVLFIENSGVSAWNGWQSATVTGTSTFTFSATTGSATAGNVGVLVDDVDSALFTGANLDSRAGSLTNGTLRTLVLGQRIAQVALDSNYYSRALQTNSRHILALTCDGSTSTLTLVTQNIPAGNTYGAGIPADPANPGAYALPTVQWVNQNQALIDPTSGLRSVRTTGPTGAASSATAFGSAVGSGWTNPSGPLTSGGGSATWTGPCGSGTCPLFVAVGSSYTITGATWSGGTAVATVSGTNNVAVGQMITVSSVTPSGFNTLNPVSVAVTAVGTNTISYPLANNPGTYSSGGTLMVGTANNLGLSGGATYTNTGTSIDWFKLSIAAASISSTGGTLNMCLTVNGVSCAGSTHTQALTSTPSPVASGTTTVMDLWQASGPPTIARPDVPLVTGTVNYTASAVGNCAAHCLSYTGGGAPFSIKWGAGSTVNVAGTSYTVASVQSELLLSLSTFPGSTLTGVTVTANNFGVLLWSTTLNTVSLGYATFTFGSTAEPTWPAASSNNCSPVVNNSAGAPGYNCFLGQELWWFSADGNTQSDMGAVGMTDANAHPRWNDNAPCNTAGNGYPFDPLSGDTWYCDYAVKYWSGSTYLGQAWGLVKAVYTGSHGAGTPGAETLNCANSGVVQPCITYTVMGPTMAQTPLVEMPAFNAEWASSGYTGNGVQFAGISPDGYAEFFINQNTQDSPGWMGLYNLGDRTPEGTDSNSMKLVAAGSTYLHAPLSYCTIHDGPTPLQAYAWVISNDYNIRGTPYVYTMSMTSATLNTTVGIAGGLNTCPSNPFGIAGNNCTAITVTGPPTQPLAGATQALGVGDVMQFAQYSENVRVVSITDSTHFTVQRGYLSGPVTSSNTTFNMICGLGQSGALGVYAGGTGIGYWPYTADPFGTNAAYTTTVNLSWAGGHNYLGAGLPAPPVSISANGGNYLMQAGYNPPSLSTYAVAGYPPFAGVASAMGQTNGTDSHGGPCFGSYCVDGHPFAGGDPAMAAPSTAPFALVTGQLYKVSGASAILHRKILPTMAYVGRSALVDVSGPASSIGSTGASAYTYCYANAAAECYAGSSVGDLFVNAPFVSYLYCPYAGVATQGDDTNSICISDLSSDSGQLVQVGSLVEDDFGAMTRFFGSSHERWNMFYTYSNWSITQNGAVGSAYVRWFNGIRTDSEKITVPPYPGLPDGINRQTFEPVVVPLTAPAGASTAEIQFGYAENGTSAGYYCTSRQEACNAVSATVNQTTPDYFSSETFSRASCASSCTITIPALPQRVLYWVAKFYDSGGTLISTAQPQAITTL